MLSDKILNSAFKEMHAIATEEGEVFFLAKDVEDLLEIKLTDVDEILDDDDLIRYCTPSEAGPVPVLLISLPAFAKIAKALMDPFNDCENTADDIEEAFDDIFHGISYLKSFLERAKG